MFLRHYTWFFKRPNLWGFCGFEVIRMSTARYCPHQGYIGKKCKFVGFKFQKLNRNITFHYWEQETKIGLSFGWVFWWVHPIKPSWFFGCVRVSACLSVDLLTYRWCVLQCSRSCTLTCWPSAERSSVVKNQIWNVIKLADPVHH